MGDYRKLLLFVILFLFSGVLFGQREVPVVKNGVLDFSEWDFQRDGNLKLEGNWEFYWSKLYYPSDFRDSTIIPDAHVAVPGVWTGTKVDGLIIPNTGCATYRLTVISSDSALLQMSFKEIISAYKVWVNNEVIVEVGVVAADRKYAKPAYQLNKVPVFFKKGSNEIIVQVSNFNHRANAFEYAPVVGTIENIDKEDFADSSADLIILGLLLIMALYHLGLFFFRPQESSLLIFSIFCFLALFRGMVTVNCLLGRFFTSPSWDLVYFIKYFTFYTIVPLLGLLIQQTFNEKRFKWVFNSLYIVAGLFLLTLFLPSLIYTQLLIVWECIVVAYYVLVLGVFLVKYALSKLDGAVILLFSVTFLAMTTVNDMLFYNDVINTFEMVPLGIFILILGEALTLAKRFWLVYNKNEELAAMLANKNESLQTIVNERTKQLEEEKLKLSESNSKLLKYFTAIEHASATIVITDVEGNIEYANPQFSKVTGYSFAEAKGKNPRILKSGKMSDSEYKELWQTISRGEVWYGEFVNLTKQKQEYTERATISPVKNDEGKIINYIAIKEDVTTLKRYDFELKESERKYRLLAENSTDVIWVLNLQSLRYSYISPSISKLRGLTVEEAMNEQMMDSLTEESFRKATGLILDAVEKAKITPLIWMCNGDKKNKGRYCR